MKLSLYFVQLSLGRLLQCCLKSAVEVNFRSIFELELLLLDLEDPAGMEVLWLPFH